MPVNANESAALLDLAKSFTSSYEQRDRLSAALREHLGVTPRDSFYVSDDGTDDVLGPVVIYRMERGCYEEDHGGCRLVAKNGPSTTDESFFRVTYARLGDGYTFGEPVKVRRVTAYEAVRDSDAGEGLDAGQNEAEVPEWLAGALARAASLTKGAGHRYIRRVPKSGGGYRYFYKVSGGGGLGHEDEMKVGAKFRVANGGKEGHFEIVGKDDKGNLRIKHDESGHESSVSPAALRSMLHAEHAQSLTAHREKLAADIKATDDPKAKAKLLAEAGKYEHTRDLAEPEKPGAKVLAFPEKPRGGSFHERAAAALGWSVKDAQSMSLQALRDNLRTVAPDLADEATRQIASGKVVEGAPLAPPKSAKEGMSWLGDPNDWKTGLRPGDEAPPPKKPEPPKERGFTGEKYDPMKRVADIAKELRETFKTELPQGVKLGIKTRNYSGGSAIDVTIKDAPFAILNPARVRWHATNPHTATPPREGPAAERYTPEGKALLDKIQSEMDKHNRNNSDSRSDYYDVGFSSHVDVGDEVEERDRSAAQAAGAEQGTAAKTAEWHDQMEIRHAARLSGLRGKNTSAMTRSEKLAHEKEMDAHSAAASQHRGASEAISSGDPYAAQASHNAIARGKKAAPEFYRQPFGTRKSMSTVTDPERDLAKSLAASHRAAAMAQPDAGAKAAHEAAAQACDAAATADSTGDFRRALGAAERIGGLIKAWSGIPADQRRDFGAFAKSMQSPGGRLGDIRFAASNGTGDALGQMGRAFENARPPAEQLVQVAPEPTTYSPQRGAVNGMRKSMGSFYDRLSAGAAQQAVQGIRCPPEAKV